MRRSPADSTNRSLAAFGKLQHIRLNTLGGSSSAPLARSCRSHGELFLNRFSFPHTAQRGGIVCTVAVTSLHAQTAPCVTTIGMSAFLGIGFIAGWGRTSAGRA